LCLPISPRGQRCYSYLLIHFINIHNQRVSQRSSLEAIVNTWPQARRPSAQSVEGPFSFSTFDLFQDVDHPFLNRSHNQALYCLIQTVSLFENILSFLSKGGKNFKNLKSNRYCFLFWYLFFSICFWNQTVSSTSSSSRFTIKRNLQSR